VRRYGAAALRRCGALIPFALPEASAPGIRSKRTILAGRRRLPSDQHALGRPLVVNETRMSENPLETLVEANVFKTLYEKRILYLRGPIEDTVADTLVAQLMALDAESDKDVTLYINSPGGIVSGMFAIYDVIHLMNAKVNTVCVGMAASAAAFLLATPTGTRAATPNARIMVHQPLGGARGQAVDIQIQAQQIVFLRERLNEILAERTGQPLEQIQKDTDRDFWLSAAEAVEYGAIDEVRSRGGV
jgi:ATP-dependent Clp protease, protease subunit